MSYNALLTTSEANAKVKPIVFVVTIKSTLTCTNCGKIGHSMETNHKRKKSCQLCQLLQLNLWNL